MADHLENNEKETGFSALYHRWYTPMYRFLAARASSKEIAEDLVQSVFVKAWKALYPQGKSEATKEVVTQTIPAAYFYTLARNTLIDHWRKRKTDRLDEEVEMSLPDTRPLISEVLSKEQEVKPALDAIAALPSEQREVLMLRFFDELETAEIAEIMGKSEMAIRQIQCRALKALRKELTQKIPA